MSGNTCVNRSVLSSAAAAARQRLLERMFTHEAEADLGFAQTPPEKAMYLSVLKLGDLHAMGDDGWTFRAPAAGQGGWGPVVAGHGSATRSGGPDQCADRPYPLRATSVRHAREPDARGERKTTAGATLAEVFRAEAEIDPGDACMVCTV